MCPQTAYSLLGFKSVCVCVCEDAHGCSLDEQSALAGCDGWMDGWTRVGGSERVSQHALSQRSRGGLTRMSLTYFLVLQDSEVKVLPPMI